MNQVLNVYRKVVEGLLQDPHVVRWLVLMQVDQRMVHSNVEKLGHHVEKSSLDTGG